MTADERTVGPIPQPEFCVNADGNFQDEDQEECTGAYFGEYDTLEETGPLADIPCAIHWTEDLD